LPLENHSIEANGVSVQEERAYPISANTEPTVMGFGAQSFFPVHQAYSDQSIAAKQPHQRVAPRHGVVDAFLNTCDRWKVSDKEKLILLGYGDSPVLGNQILDSRTIAIPQDVRDRAAYLLAISVGLGTIFHEVADAERAWLNLSSPGLGDKAPLAFMLEGRMANLTKVLRLVEQERCL
jgi:hypothetical protein